MLLINLVTKSEKLNYNFPKFFIIASTFFNIKFVIKYQKLVFSLHYYFLKITFDL